jgi:hypothetical protein
MRVNITSAWNEKGNHQSVSAKACAAAYRPPWQLPHLLSGQRLMMMGIVFIALQNMKLFLGGIY